MLDLHCHTACSDGTLTPTELVRAAAQAGVRALGITDHDTLAGWSEAFAAATAFENLEIVPGLELSTIHRDRSLHILGFYPNPEQLQAPLTERLEARQRRAQAMIDRLEQLGYPIQLPDLSLNRAPGRPHIAAALVQAGYVQSSPEAFDRFLADDKPAYVPYEPFSSLAGLQVLRDCAAVSVWAHPYLFRGGEVEDVLPELVAAGLMGLEVYHPSHTPTQVQRLKNLCDRYGLLQSGGSDYHGPTPDSKRSHRVELNSLQIPLSLLNAIQDRATFFPLPHDPQVGDRLKGH